MKTLENTAVVKLPKPTCQLQEVLFELIRMPFISRREALSSLGILNLTSRIADLRGLNLEIKCKRIKWINKHGRETSYGVWSLTDKEAAKSLYLRINSANRK